MDQNSSIKKNPLLQYDFSEDGIDEFETDLVTIELESNQKISINYSQLCKHSQLIRNKYLISDVRSQLPKDIQKFQQENKIKSSNLKSFFKLIQDEDIEMTNDKYFDFYKLSEFFQVKSLSKNLDKYYERSISNIDFIIQFILNEIETNENSECQLNFSLQMERILANHINEFLKNESTVKLPSSFVFRILQESNEEEYPMSEIFNLIIKSIDKFCILFSFIDLKRITDDQFSELYEKYSKPENEKFFKYLPCNLDYINELKTKNKKYLTDVDHLQKENSFLSKNISKIESELLQTNQKYQQLNTQFQEREKEFQKEKSNLQLKIFELNQIIQQNNKGYQKRDEELNQIIQQNINAYQKRDDELNQVIKNLNLQLNDTKKNFERTRLQFLAKENEYEQNKSNFLSQIKELKLKNTSLQSSLNKLMHENYQYHNNKNFADCPRPVRFGQSHIIPQNKMFDYPEAYLHPPNQGLDNFICIDDNNS